jgi:hypothetical protein
MKILVLKLATLFSYCGGPLFVGELLKPRVGVGQGFVITFLPVGLMLLGALFLEDTRTRWTIAAVRTGCLGLAIALAMHVYALGCFMSGKHVAEQYLYDFGIAVGVVWSVVYLRAVRRWEWSADASSLMRDRMSDTIEPS